MRKRHGVPLRERTPLLRVEAHPTRGWRMLPGEDHYSYSEYVTINQAGLRGAELSPKKPGERVIFCLGDSLIYGQGVGDSEALPAQLESQMNEHADSNQWRVINGGHRAYATHQELALLAELGPSIQPDWVILFWYSNDFNERSVAESHAYLAASGPQIFDLGLSALAGRERAFWYVRQGLRRSAALMWARDVWLAARAPKIGVEARQACLKQWDERLAQFRSELARLGARGLVAVIPDAQSLLMPHPSRDLGILILARARAAGLLAIDLYDSLRPLAEERSVPLTLPYDGHYTGRAYGAFSRALCSHLPKN